MKKIGASDKADLEKRADDLREQRDAILNAIATYNDTLSGVRGLAKELHREQKAHFNDRTDKWKSGKSGKAYEAWLAELEKLSETEDLQEPEIEHPEKLDELSDAPGDPPEL